MEEIYKKIEAKIADVNHMMACNGKSSPASKLWAHELKGLRYAKKLIKAELKNQLD